MNIGFSVDYIPLIYVYFQYWFEYFLSKRTTFTHLEYKWREIRHLKLQFLSNHRGQKCYKHFHCRKQYLNFICISFSHQIRESLLVQVQNFFKSCRKNTERQSNNRKVTTYHRSVPTTKKLICYPNNDPNKVPIIYKCKAASTFYVFYHKILFECLEDI